MIETGRITLRMSRYACVFNCWNTIKVLQFWPLRYLSHAELDKPTIIVCEEYWPLTSLSRLPFFPTLPGPSGAMETCWWASSSDMLIYPSIFAFPSLSLHCRSTTTHLHSDATACDRARTRTTIALTLLDRSCLFDGHKTYDSHVFTSILSVSNVPPPAVRPIMSSRTVRSGTFSNFAICSHSCLPFVFT